MFLDKELEPPALSIELEVVGLPVGEAQKESLSLRCQSRVQGVSVYTVCTHRIKVGQRRGKKHRLALGALWSQVLEEKDKIFAPGALELSLEVWFEDRDPIDDE